MAEKKKNHKGHFWIMIICCAVMVGGFFLIGRGGTGNWGGTLLILLCPLMHIFMMKGHMGHNEHDQDEGENYQHHH